MLDIQTRHRIDTARDILVGKVPDPKSQVEQITIALIYKFMDDMDAEAEELGGKRKFFAGDFARYGWAKLMHSGLGGFETLNLYAEAITKMQENPGIPSLFREIFKNAYLPYRDPETLRAFLKVIDEFEYDHSERLGDAFEYLLSVLGSQGDAGQFRTPRHIIDFIVGIVDPKKQDRVLDPACGTAGFLISSYKHILKANTDDEGTGTLTPDEKGHLASNFRGYDISPDMVRLSLVNMYLHGFTDPHIFEYDTLTSQDRWNEYADVILANPPFMSPKGGIRPHNRFSVQSKRSEVLFVDYMVEHLAPGGRAGIIVPEGVVSQGQAAYARLRKMLVDEYLVAVVSLPAGVFNPYSGVKTSILILDKSIANTSGSIAFFTVENDGFNLGAQRRPIDKNDLPLALLEINEYLDRLRARESLADFRPALGLVVPKAKIAADGEYRLSGDRYREAGARPTEYCWQPIGSIVETVTPPTRIQKTGFGKCGRFPIIDQSRDDIAGWTDDESAVIRPGKPLVIFGDHTCVIKLVDTPFAQGADGIKILSTSEGVEPRFLYYMLRSRPLANNGYQRHFSMLKEYQIPIPPLEVQKSVVAEVEGYQRVIDGARAVVSHYRPQVPIRPDWPLVEIGDVCRKIQYGLSSPLNVRGVGFKTFRMNELVAGHCVDNGDMKYADISLDEFKKYELSSGDILFNRTNSFEHVGRTAIFDLKGSYCFASYLIRLCVNEEKADPYFLNAFMNSASFQRGIKQFASRAIGQSNINAKNLAQYPIPVPSLATQRAIVAEINAERALIDANRELVSRFEAKIQATLARVWGEDECVPVGE